MLFMSFSFSYLSGMYTAQVLQVCLFSGLAMTLASAIRFQVWEKESHNIEMMQVGRNVRVSRNYILVVAEENSYPIKTLCRTKLTLRSWECAGRWCGWCGWPSPP